MMNKHYRHREKRRFDKAQSPELLDVGWESEYDQLGCSTFSYSEDESAYVRKIEKRLTTRTPKPLEYMEEQRLLELARIGDKVATIKLLKQYENLVRQCVKHFLSDSDGAEWQDLVQQGTLGLLNAIRCFDFAKGRRLAPYAEGCIRNSVLAYIYDCSKFIRTTRHWHQIQEKIASVSSSLAIELSRDPTDAEIAASTGFKISRVRKAQIYEMQADVRSIDGITADDEEDIVICSVPCKPEHQPDFLLEEKDSLEFLQHTLNKLSSREKAILCLRTGFYSESKITFSEIGKLFGISRQRAEATYKHAIQKLTDLAKLTEKNEEVPKIIDSLRLLFDNVRSGSSQETDREYNDYVWFEVLPSRIPESLRHQIYYLILVELKRHQCRFGVIALLNNVVQAINNNYAPELRQNSSTGTYLASAADWAHWALQHLLLSGLLRESSSERVLVLTDAGLNWLKNTENRFRIFRIVDK